jgi:hypothetical protein
MEYIDIDSRDFNYTNDGLFLLFKNYIEYKEVIYDEEGIEISMFQRMSVVCSGIGYLTDEKLLNHTLDYLKTADLIEDIKEDFENELMSAYSQNELIRIKAIYYSLSSMYKLNIKHLKFPSSENSIRLEIKIKDRIIEHNLQEVLKSIRQTNISRFEELISILPIDEQKVQINKWVRSALKVGRTKGTKMFKKDIEYLKGVSNHLIEPERPKPASKNSLGIFSALEWATIFYYADSSKYFNQKNIIEKQAFFIEKHKITTSKNSLKNKVIAAKNAINVTQTYSIDKLNYILPFVRENYSKGVTFIENDKLYLDENNNKENGY